MSHRIDVTHRSRDLWHRIRAMCELSVLCHKRKVEREERQREEMSKKGNVKGNFSYLPMCIQQQNV